MFYITLLKRRVMMVELTYGGTWLKWSSLDRTDRNWAIASFATAILAAVPISIQTADWGYALGYGAASGRIPSSTPLTPLLASDLFAYAMIVLFVIDLEHRILPDVITLPGIILGFAFSFFSSM